MGAVSRDMEKKAREYDAAYDYNREGVSDLLRDIHRMKESRLYDGDIDATAILVDLFDALDSDCLTPRMRQVVALYYFAGLTESEIKSLLSVERHSVNEFKQKAVDRISAHMYDSSTFMAGNPYEPLSEDGELNVWLNAVALRQLPIYKVPFEIFRNFNQRFASSDRKSAEVLRQQREGIVYVEDLVAEEYPCLTDDQFAWRDRRITYAEEVFPPNDVIGRRKVAIKLRDDKKGREYIVEKRKLFKVRGN